MYGCLWDKVPIIRFMAPIPEATFFDTFSIWPLQSSLSSMVTASDFAVVTWLTPKSLIASVGDILWEYLASAKIQEEWIRFKSMNASQILI